MDLAKKLIIILITIIVVVLVVIGIVTLMRNRKPNSDTTDTEFEHQGTYEPNTKLELLTNRNKFYAVKNIINMYYDAISGLNINAEDAYYYVGEDKAAEFIKENTQENAKILYSMLNDDVINQLKITSENLKEKLEIKRNVVATVEKMYSVEKSASITRYFAYGYTRSSNANSIEDFALMITLDSLNNTFDIAPSEYMELKGYSNVNVGDNIRIDVESIENKKYNVFSYKNISDEAVATDYFNLYKANMQYKVKSAYDSLDREYREKRFGNIEEYMKFIQNKELPILDKYQKISDNGIVQYVCVDKEDNYYIFEEIGIMQYALMLDTYTIDVPQFVDKYKAASEQEKVALNIQKFVDAINAKDYKYVYGKLADGFKNNNFKTQGNFEVYAKKQFFSINELELVSFSNEGNTYIYKVNLIDKEGTNNNVTKTFIMQLGEGTDFVMSFNMD